MNSRIKARNAFIKLNKNWRISSHSFSLNSKPNPLCVPHFVKLSGITLTKPKLQRQPPDIAHAPFHCITTCFIQFTAHVTFDVKIGLI